MKNIISSLLLLLVLPFVAVGQNHTPESFLNVRAIGTGTNSLGSGNGSITNLSLYITNANLILYGSNLVFTNLSGSVIQGANYSQTTNSVTRASLFRNVPLWTTRNGNQASTIYFPSNTLAALSTNAVVYSPLTVVIKIANPWGTNGPIGLNFTPIWYDDFVPDPGYTADDWSVVFPGGTGKYRTLATNAPLWRWNGAKYLAVRTITNEFNITTATATTNAPFLVDLRAVGFVP